MLDSHLRTLESIDAWTISGRLSVTTGKRGQIGKMRWYRNGSSHRIEIYSTLGSGHARILSDPNKSVLVDSEGVEIVAITIEQVLDEYVGWHIPAAQLQSWIIGKAYRQSPAELEWDSAGRITSIEQSGWRVEISRYDQVGDHQLPMHLRLLDIDEAERTNPPQQDTSRPTEIRLVISNWTVN